MPTLKKKVVRVRVKKVTRPMSVRRKNAKKRETSVRNLTRPSPSKSAALTSVGTVLEGNWGKMYVVAKRSNGTHFWKVLVE